MFTISDWAPLQNTSNKKRETRQDRIPIEKGLPLPKGRKFTSEKFPSWHCHPQSQGNKENEWSAKEQTKIGVQCLPILLPVGGACLLGSKEQGAPWLAPGYVYRACYERTKQPQRPAPTCRKHQHTHLHFGGHSVNLSGVEPQVLALVVGSEV